MPAAQFNMLIEQGAIWDASVTWTAAGVPLDLTGYTVEVVLVMGGVRTIWLSSAPPIGVTFGPLNATGVIAFSASAAVTSAFISGGSYQIEAHSGANEYRIVEGCLTVSPSL